MKLSELANTISSATTLKVYIAKTRDDAKNEKSDWNFVWTTDIADSPIGDSFLYRDVEVEYVYPKSKDLLEAWIVYDYLLVHALDKLGKNAVAYLTRRSELFNKHLAEDDKICAKNEGRIDGYIRCLKDFNILNDDELTAIANYFPDKIETGIEE